MQAVDVDFLLSGTDMSWQVSLPFCPLCDRTILESLTRAEKIH